MTSPRRRSTIRAVYLTAIVALGTMFSTAAATGATVEGVALLKSAERQKILVEGAKKEGKLMFYTALIVDQVVRPVKAAFEREYPFIQLEFFRANSDRLAQKILAEYQAKRYDVDVISGSGATTMGRQAGYMQKFFSAALGGISRRAQRPAGILGFDQRVFYDTGVQ